MHPPFIEAENGRTGRGGKELVATLHDPSFHRDYLLFDILGGARHGMQNYSITPKLVGEDVSDELYRHTHVFVRDAEEHTKAFILTHSSWDLTVDEVNTRYFKGPLKSNTWYKEHDVVPDSGHGSPYYITLEEARNVQARYTLLSEAAKNSPEGLAEAEKIASHERGLIVVKGLSLMDPYHKGMDQAITMMEWAERTYGQPTRMVFCFTY